MIIMIHGVVVVVMMAVVFHDLKKKGSQSNKIIK